jgi:streptogramin lyase
VVGGCGGNGGGDHGKSVRFGPLAFEITAGGGSVWVAHSDGLIRIDARTRRTVGTYPRPDRRGLRGVGGPIAFADGSVWAVIDERLWRFDPATNRFAGPLVSRPGGRFAREMVAAEGLLWVLYDEPGLLVRVDSRSGREAGPPVRLPDDVSHAAAGAGAVWVSAPDPNRLLRVDRRSGRVQTLRLVLDGRGTPGRVTVGGGSVWLSNAGDLIRVDPSTGRESGRAKGAGFASGLAATGREVWVQTERGGRAELSSWDAGTLEPRVKRRRVGGNAAGLALGDGALWVLDPGQEYMGDVEGEEPRLEGAVRRIGLQP